MMKKILYLLVMLLPLWCVSCSDDDDNEPGMTKDGKRLVAKITEVDRYNDNDRTETTFEYDKDARLEKFIEKYYSGDYLEEEFSVTFSYSADKIVAKIIDGGEGGVGELTHHTATFILNGQGYISEYEVMWNPTDEDAWIESGTFVYNSKGQVIEETYMEDEFIGGSEEYIWNNDELVKVIEKEDGSTTTYSYFYTDQENKVNFDFNRLLGGLGSDYYLDELGYMGKFSSRNLPEKCKGREVSYKFDGEGYPVEIKHDDSIYTIEYK